MKFWAQMRVMPRDVWVLFITALINRLGTMVLPFLVLYLTRELQFSVSQSGLIIALYGVGAMVTAPLSGMLCDRFGAGKILKLSLVLSSICLFIFPLFTSLGSVFALTILLAITTEMFRPASATLITTSVQPQQRKMAYALYRQAISIGLSIGPAVGGFLAGVSFFYIFLVDGLTSLAGGVIAILAMPSRSGAPAKGEVEPVPGQADPSLRVWKDLHFIYYLIALLPILITFFQHLSTMPLYMVRNLKLSEAAYGLSFTFNTVLVILFEVPLNFYTSHWSFRRALPLGALLIGLGFGCLMFARDFWSVLATVFIWSVGEMMFLPGTAAYVAEIAPPNRQGQYMGFYTMAFSVAFTIGPWFGTFLMEKYGSTFLWIFMFFLGVISTFMLLKIHRHPKPNLSHV